MFFAFLAVCALLAFLLPKVFPGIGALKSGLIAGGTFVVVMCILILAGAT